MRLIPAALCTGSLWLALAAAPPAAAWQSGPWTGQAHRTQAGLFVGCRMWLDYPNGFAVQFLAFRDKRLYLGFGRQNWILDPASPYVMTVDVDGTALGRARGTVLAEVRDTLWLDLGTAALARDTLRRGRLLTLLDRDRRYEFALTGSAQALRRLDACVTAGGP